MRQKPTFTAVKLNVRFQSNSESLKKQDTISSFQSTYTTWKMIDNFEVPTNIHFQKEMLISTNVGTFFTQQNEKKELLNLS